MTVVGAGIQAPAGERDGALDLRAGRERPLDLSGPLVIGSDGLVDRIAFVDLLPGAAIGVGGSLNTLDVLNTVNLTSGPGISVGHGSGATRTPSPAMTW